MTTTLNAMYRPLSCAFAAMLITLIVGLAFVQSTSVAPGARYATSGITQTIEQA
ncbi:MAG TPA: hypothetical protein VEH54_08040 [Steroidobacteraceae bacterium]|nr:hypothetical protein [Steroidobacteraceae bacterium]